MKAFLIILFVAPGVRGFNFRNVIFEFWRQSSFTCFIFTTWFTDGTEGGKEYLIA